MCMECGCHGKNKMARLQFSVSGYTEESVRAVETRLLGLAGVMCVHIHATDGMTEIDYDPKKTGFAEIVGAFEHEGLSAGL